jgi:endonuclease VIII
MAEGDTILRAKNRLTDALVGQSIAVSTPNPRGRAAGVGRLDGRTLAGIDAHGKHLLFDFGDIVLHSHLGMSGGWHVYPRGARWRRPRSSAWVVLGGERADAVQFGGPTLRVLPAARVAIDPQLARLGPDILAPDLDLDDVVAKFRAADPTRTLGDALLDQRILAGIGNVWKSESCFAAAINPWRPLARVNDEEVLAVVEFARERMRVSADGDGFSSRPRAVYNRAGMPCPRCRTPIRQHGQGDDNRTTFWCPGCQL